jgi:hypothetical protein
MTATVPAPRDPADDESFELGRSDALAGVSGRLGLDDVSAVAYWAGHDSGRAQAWAGGHR